MWVGRAADDVSVGAGGVGGVRAGLIAGPGWARVNHRQALFEAFMGRGVGTTAVLLEARGDGQIGHARAWHHTTNGVRGVDPQSQRPAGRVYEINTPGDPDQPAAPQQRLDGPDGRAGVVETWAVLIDGQGHHQNHANTLRTAVAARAS